MTEKELLVAAKALIEDPKHWCQGQYARNRNGDPDRPDSETACSFCSVGALMRARLPEPFLDVYQTARQRLSEVSREMGYEALGIKTPVVHLNDFTDHATVMKMYDTAIERAGG